MSNEYHCRICGLFQGGELRDPSETGGNILHPDGSSPYFLHTICACCGTEFGIEDDGATEADALFHVRQRRQAWLKAGAAWFSPREKPDDWNLDAQLKQIPDGWA